MRAISCTPKTFVARSSASSGERVICLNSNPSPSTAILPVRPPEYELSQSLLRRSANSSDMRCSEVSTPPGHEALP